VTANPTVSVTLELTRTEIIRIQTLLIAAGLTDISSRLQAAWYDQRENVPT
jgi:hypothetical protein